MTGPTYRYKKRRGTPALPAQAVGEELSRIKGAAGELTPKAIVGESRPKEAVLHGQFEWRDAVAGEKYREHQARNIVNVVEVVPERPEGGREGEPTQAFVSVVEAAPGEERTQGYERVEGVLADPIQRAKYLQRCLEKLIRVQREFRVLREFANVWTAIDDLAESMS